MSQHTSRVSFHRVTFITLLLSCKLEASHQRCKRISPHTSLAVPTSIMKYNRSRFGPSGSQNTLQSIGRREMGLQHSLAQVSWRRCICFSLLLPQNLNMGRVSEGHLSRWKELHLKNGLCRKGTQGGS